ncbi:type I glyceraldehyde-3-phosphate dehydrogenase [bacterium]|jgi:glyceraldehyde 3-phosphate dehydrogenase|nr:type I glyceraldehyde-3-phosphate dehydrogenase [bacterium]MDP6659822.1 glyceraldehyde 3-phosphate dehydrogenase NAD-binding domain-containing protein [Candidatus Paceibacterota bacterium]|tara:strand:- start:49086 stop:50114 length:1029 start_codon:yes stop_codon:yes gene_type:complete
MKKVRVGINGFGRIGRSFFRIAKDRDDIEIVAINDLGDIENLAYLLKYDSVYGVSDFEVEVRGENIVAGGREFKFLSEDTPENLPWGKLNVDVALESSGAFTSYEKSQAHLSAGAKRVVVSAPVKDAPPSGVVGATVLMGVNEDVLKMCDISSNASCTTNAGSPIMQILKETIGVEKALLNTIHGYTASQGLVDGPSKKKDFRRGRAAAVNIVPSTTGAAIATTKAITDLEGRFDGMAIRVPTIAGSIVDITFISKKETTVEEINEILTHAAGEKRWNDIFSVTDEPIVSSDILGSRYASIADLSFTRVVDGNLVKVLSWYDNEVGYTYTLVDHVAKTGQHT